MKKWKNISNFSSFLTQNKCLSTFNFSALSASFQFVYLLLLTHLFFKTYNIIFLPLNSPVKLCYKSFSKVIIILSGCTVLMIVPFHCSDVGIFLFTCLPFSYAGVCGYIKQWKQAYCLVFEVFVYNLKIKRFKSTIPVSWFFIFITIVLPRKEILKEL